MLGMVGLALSFGAVPALAARKLFSIILVPAEALVGGNFAMTWFKLGPAGLR